MFSLKFTTHIAISRAIVCALHPSAVFDAFNASKASHTTTLPSPATSATAATRPNASNVANSAAMSMPQYTVAGIVVSVGLHYASFSNTMVQHRIARLQVAQFCTSLVCSANSRSSGVDTDIDDEVPQHAAPYIPVYWTMAPFLARPANSTNVATPYNNKVSIGVQATSLLPPSLSILPSHSSPSGSDFSFECATPPVRADVNDIYAPRVVCASEGSSPLPASLPSQDLRIMGHPVDALEGGVAELTVQCQEAVTYNAQPDTLDSSALQSDFTTSPYSEDNVLKVEAKAVTQRASADTAADVDESQAQPTSAPKREPIELRNRYSGNVYTVSGIIGEGSFARVVAAESNGQVFGIKVVHKANVYGHPGARRSLLLEKAVMINVAGYNTDRLVHMLESWESRANIYFVMVSPLSNPCHLEMQDFTISL